MLTINHVNNDIAPEHKDIIDECVKMFSEARDDADVVEMYRFARKHGVDVDYDIIHDAFWFRFPIPAWDTYKVKIFRGGRISAQVQRVPADKEEQK